MLSKEQILTQEIEKTLDPRVKRTRQLLEQAFMELMQEKTFQEITVQDITNRATINRATFYAHFVDKYDMLDRIIQDHFNALIQSKLSVSCNVNDQTLQTLIATVFDFVARFNGECAKQHSSFEPPVEARVQAHLHNFILGWFKKQQAANKLHLTNPDITAAAISWVIFGIGLERSHNKKTYTVQDTARQIQALLAGDSHFEGD